MIPSKFPIAVLIADVHYNLNTLERADRSMRTAIGEANRLDVPLIVAGDLHDTKALLRGECVNAIVETFKLAKFTPYVIIGNHCRINEKSKEHSLNFLDNKAFIVDKEPWHFHDWLLVPYNHDPSNVYPLIKDSPKVIMHQGLKTGNPGEYINDHSALEVLKLTNKRIISGHYHTRQTIELLNGTWDYIGNPYSLTFGEAKDPDKGFQVLYDDGSLEFIPTNEPKHVVITIDGSTNNISISSPIKPKDYILVKYTCDASKVPNDIKKYLIERYNIPEDFKLEVTLTKQDIDDLNTADKLTTDDLIYAVIENKYKDDKTLQDDLKVIYNKIKQLN